MVQWVPRLEAGDGAKMGSRGWASSRRKEVYQVPDTQLAQVTQQDKGNGGLLGIGPVRRAQSRRQDQGDGPMEGKGGQGSSPRSHLRGS